MTRTQRAAAGLLVALLPVAAAAADASLCPDALRTVFSCRTGAKTISVCASADLSRNSGFLQYRFGTPQRTELVLPTTREGWRETTRAAVLSYSGGGGATIIFRNGDYRYIVYTAIGHGWGRTAGVVVDQHERRIASLRCSGEVRSELGPELFDAAGIEADAQVFELP